MSGSRGTNIADVKLASHRRVPGRVVGKGPADYNSSALGPWGLRPSARGLPHGLGDGFLRIGLGHDTHRLGEGGPLLLGGVAIPHDHHLMGHSDADVLLHAITDALLGAASLGDIGEMFPDSVAENKGRDSGEMLRIAWNAVESRTRMRIVNLDCVVFAQRPKLSPYKAQIRDQIARILDIDPTQVGLKAKTGELVGPVGREEAISAECVLLLELSR